MPMNERQTWFCAPSACSSSSSSCSVTAGGSCSARREADLRRHDVVDELVERRDAEHAQHLCDVFGARSDVASGELVGGR